MGAGRIGTDRGPIWAEMGRYGSLFPEKTYLLKGKCSGTFVFHKRHVLFSETNVP